MIFFIILLLLLILLFFHKTNNVVPILMYHRIADIPGDRNALPPEKFRKQLDYLQQHHFTTITMEMLYEHYHDHKKLPPRPVLLTFDDGYADNFEIALPLLKEKAMTAVVFPIANWIGRENKWEDFNKAPTKTMDWQQLALWQKAGLEIASHTVNHPFLSQCTAEKVREEVLLSKAALEKNLPIQIDFLCYPYGDFSQETIAVVKASGYKAAFAIFDHAPLWNINRFALPRIPIPRRQPLWEFKLKVSRFYLLFILLRKGERAFKRSVQRLKSYLKAQQ